MKQILIISIVICLFLLGCQHHPDTLQKKSLLLAESTGNMEKGVSPSDIFIDYRIQPGDILEIGFYFDMENQRSYHLLPQDVIEVRFPSTPELNLEQRIRPDGMISMAYVGEIKAAGRTIPELKNILEGHYLKKMQKPEMYIVLKEYGRILNEFNSQTSDFAGEQNRQITVRIDGQADFPLIGEISAAGKSIPELLKRINRKYLSRYADLRVELFLSKTVGAKICVLGAVKEPGFYQIDYPVSLLEAIALAGGTDPGADISGILTVRRNDEQLTYQEISLENMIKGTPGTTHFLISHKDIVYVPTSAIANAAVTAKYIADMIFLRGWGFNVGYDLDD